MRSEQFHTKGKAVKDMQVNECSRLTVDGVDQVNVYQVDDQGKRVKLLKTGQKFKIKLNNVDAIDIESKEAFNSVLEGPDELDKTPIEVAVEKPLTQTQQLRMWLQNEQNIRQNAAAELTWEEFQDLGNMDDADEFYSQFNQDLTRYEMQAEALIQHANPNRGMDLNEENAIAGDKHKRLGQDDKTLPLDDTGTKTGGEETTEGGESTER